jgi:Methyltransferase domain
MKVACGFLAEMEHEELEMGPSSIDSYIKSRSVEGWLNDGDARVIAFLADAQSRMGVEGHVAEIGVHHGRLFILLYLLMLRSGPGKALAIDLFEDQARNVDGSGEGDSRLFRSNLVKHAGDSSRLLMHQGDSTLLDGASVREFVGGPVRLFSIDGGHTESITCHDLETAEAAIADGGIIILDDCFNPAWPGVISGVLRFSGGTFGNRSIRPFAIGHNKVFLARHTWCGVYMDTLRSFSAKTSDSEFLGTEVVCLRYDPNALAGWLRKSLWPSIKHTRIGSRLRRGYLAWGIGCWLGRDE